MSTAGGIQGAITDPYSSKAMQHAIMYYEEIRHNHVDAMRIAENTDFTYDQVLMIKNYLFLHEHDLDGEIKRFDPSFEIASSWQRLAFMPDKIQPHDITLLHHELKEMELIGQGLSQYEAHIIASEEYNYAIEASEYYTSLGYQFDVAEQELDMYNKTSGAVTYDPIKTWEERY